MASYQETVRDIGRGVLISPGTLECVLVPLFEIDDDPKVSIADVKRDIEWCVVIVEE